MSSQTSEQPVVVGEGRDQMVEVSNLTKYYQSNGSILDRSSSAVRAVEDVSFNIPKGDTFGLVGESGCGKTTVGKSLLQIVEPTDGSVVIDGVDVTELSDAGLKAFRQKMQLVFQDPSSSLNPRRTVGKIIEDPMKIHGVGTKDERTKRVRSLLNLVGLPADSFLNRYPSSLSGGQKQRVGIARAICLDPDFVVLDEPTSALDVSVQATIVSLLERLQRELDLTFLFISHDLSLVKNFTDWIGVMYLGHMVEVGPADAVFRNPSHPYTRALLSAIPTITEDDEKLKPKETILEGELPELTEALTGCPFESRCPDAFDKCARTSPQFYRLGDEHYARCLLHDKSIGESVAWL